MALPPLLPLSLPALRTLAGGTLETVHDLHTHPLAFCLGTSRGALWAGSTGPALSEESRLGGRNPVRVGVGVERHSPGDQGDQEVQLVLAVPKRGGQ